MAICEVERLIKSTFDCASYKELLKVRVNDDTLLER